MRLNTTVVLGFAIVILLLCVPFKQRKFVVFFLFGSWGVYALLDTLPSVAMFSWGVFRKTPSWVWGFVFFVAMLPFIILGWMLDRRSNRLIKQEYKQMGGKLGWRGRERIQTLMRDHNYSSEKAEAAVTELAKE